MMTSTLQVHGATEISIFKSDFNVGQKSGFRVIKVVAVVDGKTVSAEFFVKPDFLPEILLGE